LTAVSTIDENKAWEIFQKRIHKKEKSKKTVPVASYGWMKIAAAIIITAGLGLTVYWLLNRGNAVKEMIVEADHIVVSDTLPDRSVVTINKGSFITYPSKFQGETRNIKLKGEAFFNVTPDKKKPFVISVNDVQVTVVGTSFNVKSIHGTTEIVVETGIVKVTKDSKTEEVRAGEKLTVGMKDTVATKEQVRDHLYKYYRTKEFVCDDTPLWKLVEVLNEAYGSNISISNNELRNLRLNTTFNDESLEQVLNVISLTFNIKIVREGDRIILQ
jgi:ferric-dicitrate binding protein FerR (iron transport regulator)